MVINVTSFTVGQKVENILQKESKKLLHKTHKVLMIAQQCPYAPSNVKPEGKAGQIWSI